MPNDRFFIEETFEENQTVHLQEEEFHHLHHVMRKKPNDTIEIINGKNQLANGKILSLHKHEADIEIISVSTTPARKETLILALAHCLPSRLDTILEKATELGASSFYLFPSMLSEKFSPSNPRLQRMKKKIVSAIKQCGRLDMPPVVDKPSMEDCLEPNMTAYFGDIRPQASSLIKEKPSSCCMLFIGPEKGFCKEEVSFLEKKAKGVSLHSNILRTDTAAIIGIGTLFQLQNFNS